MLLKSYGALDIIIQHFIVGISLSSDSVVSIKLFSCCATESIKQLEAHINYEVRLKGRGKVIMYLKWTTNKKYNKFS